MIIKDFVSHLNAPIHPSHMKGGIVGLCVHPDMLERETYSKNSGSALAKKEKKNLNLNQTSPQDLIYRK